MSDENNEQTTATDTEAPDTTGSVEKLKAEVEKWKSLSRKNEDRARENAEAAKAWAAYQDTAKSDEEKRADEVEKLKKQLDEIRAESTTAVRKALAEKVATVKGVPAKYLTGDTEEDLVASADEFLADVQGIAPDRPSGVVPSAGTGATRPDVASLNTGRERALAKLNPESK